MWKGITMTELASIVTAIATFLAVIVALFRNELTKLWRKPKVDARVKLASPDCHKTRMIVWGSDGIVADKIHTYYLRLWIENTGNVRAEDVQVFIKKVARKQADDRFQDDGEFLPMNLKWSHAPPGASPVIFTNLNPGLGRHVDLGYIVDPAKSERFVPSKEVFPERPNEDQTVISLEVEVPPATYSHLLPPGEFRITLMIGGANFNPVTKVLRLVHNGDWYSDEERMFRDSLGITVM